MEKKMKILLPKIVEYNACFLDITAEFRYIGNGEDDDISPDLPGLVNGKWKAIINLGYGSILHWKADREWKIFGKVCNAGEYHLRDENFNIFATLPYGSYVQNSINGGDADYVDITVSRDGVIKDWHFDPSDFIDYYRSLIQQKG